MEMDLDFTHINNFECLSLYFGRNKEHKYARWWNLLTYAMMCSNSPEVVFTVMKAAVENGWKFRAVYPGIGEEPTDNMIGIGGILDGSLYIDAENQKSKSEIVSWLNAHGFTKEK